MCIYTSVHYPFSTIAISCNYSVKQTSDLNCSLICPRVQGFEPTPDNPLFFWFMRWLRCSQQKSWGEIQGTICIEFPKHMMLDFHGSVSEYGRVMAPLTETKNAILGGHTQWTHPKKNNDFHHFPTLCWVFSVLIWLLQRGRVGDGDSLLPCPMSHVRSTLDLDVASAGRIACTHRLQRTATNLATRRLWVKGPVTAITHKRQRSLPELKLWNRSLAKTWRKHDHRWRKPL